MNVWDDDRLFFNGDKTFGLLNANIEAIINISSLKVTTGISGKNILNKTYIDPLSKLAMYGVPNPGFSINLYLKVPFSF